MAGAKLGLPRASWLRHDNAARALHLELFTPEVEHFYVNNGAATDLNEDSIRVIQRIYMRGVVKRGQRRTTGWLYKHTMILSESKTSRNRLHYIIK